MYKSDFDSINKNIQNIRLDNLYYYEEQIKSNLNSEITKIIISIVGSIDNHKMFNYRDSLDNNLLQHYLNIYGIKNFNKFINVVCVYYSLGSWFNSVNQHGEDLYNTMCKFGIGKDYKKYSITEKNKYESHEKKEINDAINYVINNYNNYIKELDQFKKIVINLNMSLVTMIVMILIIRMIVMILMNYLKKKMS